MEIVMSDRIETAPGPMAASDVAASRPRWHAPQLQVMTLAETRNSGNDPDGSISIGPVS